MEMIEDNKPKGLIYGLEDRPPLYDALFAALQHLLAVFVAIITPPLIIAGALGLDLETAGFLVPCPCSCQDWLLSYNVAG